MRKTLLVGLAHPDDEVGAAGTILAQKACGDRVVVVWLTRGEMTEAFGPLSRDQVAARREEQGHSAGQILGVETRFMDFPDCGLQADAQSAHRVARLLAEIKPDGLLTWGDAWGHAKYQTTKSVALKAQVRVCAELAADDAEPAEGRDRRWAERLAPWRELVADFRDDGFYD